MITLTVTSFNGTPPSGKLSAVFDELGGSIGRADTNQFVLPDPDRAISRVHAQVVYRNGGFGVIDKGSNAILVNGKALGNGREAPIKDGDWLQIGGYQIEIRATGAKSRVNDPFADLLGPASAPAKKDVLSSGFDPLALTPSSTSESRIDPFAAFGAAGARPSGSTAAPSAGGIPDDWDPFAAPVQKSGAVGLSDSFGGGFGLDATGGAPAPLIPDLPSDSGSSGGDSLDALFGLKPGSVGDPLGRSVLDAAVAQPNMASSSDPLASLQAIPKASTASLPDNFSELNRPFLPPEPTSVPAASVGLAPATSASTSADLPVGAVMSWDEAGAEGRTIIRARTPQTSRSAPAVPPPASVQPPRQNMQPGNANVLASFGLDAPLAEPATANSNSAESSAPPPTAAAVADADAAVQALLAAFKEGLATPAVQVEALTPALMKLIGELLREAASGTIDLLVARAALKREIRAESTMIVAKENNPLKFSPSAEAALGHLLAPPTRGFMPAAPAMRDAYDDLRAHQYGFVAGMRAALEGVFERFDPTRLEATLTQRSALQAILPAARKAQLWESFNVLYSQIRSEAQDDFHQVFGKAFLKAYEEHIDQLQAGGRE